MTTAIELPINLDHEKIAAFCRARGIRRLSLFGSVLRDDFDPDRSDVDVLAEFKQGALVEIAKAAELSTCRVRQILRFSKLHPGIQEAMLNLSPTQARKHSPERLLREWLPLSQSEQLSQFKQGVG